MPERVFVTGALGFIGRALCDHYASQGADVRGVDVSADPERGVVAGDIGWPGEWQRHAAGSDLVIHTAAIVSMRDDPEPVWRVNVLGTRHVLDAAREAGASRFVHLSSVTVFSFNFPDGATEDHPVRANGVPYVDTKVASEQVVLQAHAAGELTCTIVRPGGESLRPRLRRAALGQAGQPRRSVACRGPALGPTCATSATCTKAPSQPVEARTKALTISDGFGVTTREFFTHYAELAGRKVRVAPTRLVLTLAALAGRLPGDDREANPSAIAYIARGGTYSIEKARRVLGYEPAVGFEEGMRRTKEWLRAEGYGA